VCLAPLQLHPSLVISFFHRFASAHPQSLFTSSVMKVFAQLSVAALASYASATAIDVNKRASPLSVELAAAGNSQVKVTVTNNGEKALNLLSKGTFLDEKLPVEKVTIYSAGGSKS
jgi:anti-sigma-K factor RskA